MNRHEYCGQVLANLRRLTAEEREAVRAELDAHMEDHICALLDLGYDEDLAEERTLARMGDPAEVGRELDKQYPLRWLVLGRVFLALLIPLCVIYAFSIYDISLKLVGDNLIARCAPEAVFRGYHRADNALVWRELDIRTQVGNDIIYVYGTGILPPEEDGRIRAAIALCVYDENWRGIPSDLLNDVTYEPQSMEDLEPGDEGWRYYDTPVVLVTREDSYITACYDKHGYSERIQVPVCWEEYDAYEANN